MKIFIDIGHPAHVHYFKNFYWEMKSRGHQFNITARDKECTHELLDHYEIQYVNRGKGSGSLPGKAAYLLEADYKLYKYAKKIDPDLFLSFCSPYAAHVSSLLGKPHIAFDDTEHATLGHLIYAPFTDTICTPYCYEQDLGDKQVRFDGFMELCALHPNRFEPDPSVWQLLGLEPGEKYIILRFVSWQASHDRGAAGIPDAKKLQLVQQLSEHSKVFISSEADLPHALKPYQITIPAHKIHDALYYARLFVGEGATMAAESTILSTPSIYVNSLRTGYHEMLGNFKLLQDFRDFDGVQAKALELIGNNNIKIKHRKEMQAFLADKIDVTSFMVWFVETYPHSKLKMQQNESMQHDFRNAVAR